MGRGRLIAGNRVPDHSATARFRKDHEGAIPSLFGQVLAPCARAGSAKPGVIAMDGTGMKASASLDANRSYEPLKKETEEKGEPASRPEFFVATKKDRVLRAEMAEAAAGVGDPSEVAGETAAERMEQKLLTEVGRGALNPDAKSRFLGCQPAWSASMVV